MRLDDAFLDEMRRTGDEPADAFVRAMLDKKALHAVNQVLSHLVRNEGILPKDATAGLDPDLGAALRDYIDLSHRPAAGIDERRVVAGQEVFRQFSLQGFMLLLFASLPASYALRDVAAVLGITHDLTDHTHRRVLETMQMALAVVVPRGLSERGHGIAVLQKVRLMHATMRVLIEHPPPAASPGPPTDLFGALARTAWDPARGKPISQEALAGVLATFTHVVLEGWRRLDIDLEPAQADAYVHCWSVAGAILGIRKELLPDGAAEAAVLYERLADRGVAATPEAAQLTDRLLAFAEQLAPGPGWVATLSRVLARPLGRTMIRLALPERTVQAVQLPALNLRDAVAHATVLHLLRAVNLFRRARRNDPVASALFSELAWIALRRLRGMSRGVGRAAFTIPESLFERR